MPDLQLAAEELDPAVRKDFAIQYGETFAGEVDVLEYFAELDVPTPVSWADVERNLTAWLGNPMQVEAHRALYAMRADVLAASASRPARTARMVSSCPARNSSSAKCSFRNGSSDALASAVGAMVDIRSLDQRITNGR